MDKHLCYTSRLKRIQQKKRKQRMYSFLLVSLIFTLFFSFPKEQPKSIAQTVTSTPTHAPTKQPTIALQQQITPKATHTPTPTVQAVKTQPTSVQEHTSTTVVSEGYVSHYSRAGCLGCDPNFIMANGQPLDDNAMTIAVPPRTLPMGTKVKLTNTDNGKEVIAEVTDTGGFAKYNRIADLTLAVGNALETKTDQSIVKIEVLQ